MRVGLGWSFLLAAINGAAQQYPFVPIPDSPRNIEHILEDRQGRLWLSTHDDVLCFDGARFFSLRDFGFPAVFSTGLAEDAEGAIVSASGAGIYRFFHGRLEHILSGVNAYEVIAVAPGVLMASTFPSPKSQQVLLYRIRADRGTWRAEALPGWKSGPFLTRDGNGRILTVCPGGWCEMDSSQHFHPSNLDMQRVARDRHGCLWFRSAEAAAYQCPQDQQPIPVPAPVAGRNVWADVRENDDGSLLFANVSSLAVGRPGAFQIVTPANGLPPESVSCAVRTRDGSIWVGTLGGLFRFPYPFRMTTWKSPYGLVWSIARWHGAMVAGTSAGVAQLNAAGEWNQVAGSRGLGSISSLLPEPGGSLFAAVSRQGVIQLRPDGTLAARTAPEQGRQAQVLARTLDGGIWAAGSGIYRVSRKGQELSLIESRPSEPGGEAFVASDSKGNLWACSASDILRFEAGTWESVVRDPLGQLPCRALAVLPNGDLWIGKTAGFLLVRSGIRQFESGGGVGSARAYFLASDRASRLWRGADDGVYVADPAAAAKGDWFHLSAADGLPQLDVNHGSFFGDTDGSVWWAAATSIVHFHPPDDLLHPSRLAPLFLSAFSIGDRPPKLAESLPELPGGRRVTAHLGSLQFRTRNALHIRYRLLPGQNTWREVPAFDLDIGSPPWGEHSLEVQSRLGGAPWSDAFAWPLVVLRPWWFSWPALAGFVAIALAGAAGGIRWTRKRRARANTVLPDLAGWRLAVLSPESQWVGKTLDRRFQLVELLSQGGFGSVFRGRDLRHRNRPAAIKIFRRGIFDEQWLAHRFQQEVSALEQLDHPSVVKIYAHGMTPDAALYLAMEFIEGGTLRDLLNLGPIPPGRAAGLLRQAAAALDTIHAHGIYHRDLKPENLMLRRSAGDGRELVLIDFSIAIVKEPDQTMHGLSRAAGTIYYMAPEQAVGFATPASDVYSLAKIVLEMITGRRLSVLLPNASMDLPERVREMARALPVRLSAESVDLLGSALEFDPARRPQTVIEFSRPLIRDLAAAASDPSTNPCLYSTNGEPAADSAP